MTDEAVDITEQILRQIHQDLVMFRDEARERFDSIDARLLAIDTRLSSIDQQLSGLHSTNAEFRHRFERIERRMNLAET